MAKSKKKNPVRKPATREELENRVRESAMKTAWAIFFTVLCDKEGLTAEDMQRIWKECEYLSDSIAQGRVNIADLQRVLADLQRVLADDYGVGLIF